MFEGEPRFGLVGRRRECEALDRLLTDVRARHSRVLVLRGEPGVGKTALLNYIVSVGSGCDAMRAAGVESEMELAFAGLQQLCAPILHHSEDLPGPQRDALGTAFGLCDGETPDRFHVGLAVLGLLSAAADERPIVCVIDDAQWLDDVSAQVLAFVARRLLAEAVAMVIAIREPNDAVAWHGLPAQRVTGLSTDDSRVLLERATPGRLDERIRDRIVAETRGNPLALLELPRGLPEVDSAGGFPLQPANPLAARIEQSFVQRLEELPSPARQLLLLAAAEPLGDLTLLRRAAALLGIAGDAETASAEAGLIEFGAHVRFSHPLVRSASYRAGSATDRRAAHRALADATDAGLDPDRRAWHRAQAAAEPDEAVAADLERAADRALRRGGVAAAAAFLQRASELTAEPTHRAERALAGAHAMLDAGSYDLADLLITAAEAGPLDDLGKARAVSLRGDILFARHRGTDVAAPLLDAAERLVPLDNRLARAAYLAALAAAIFAGRLGVDPSLHEVAVAAQNAPRSVPAALGPVDLLVDGLAARFSTGYVASAPILQEAVKQFHRQADDGDDATRWYPLAWLVAGELWDDSSWAAFATAAVRLARRSGALRRLPVALTYRAGVHLHAGEFELAAELVGESDALTAVTGSAPLKYTTGLLAAWRGVEHDFQTLKASAMREANARGEGRAIGQYGYFEAILYNGLGRYRDALAGARLAWEYDDLGVRGFALFELIEAATREDGDGGLAVEALGELERRTLAAGTDWALGVLARSRAMVSGDDDDADALYREAIDRLGRSRVIVHLARTHLVYGEWLRRRNRIGGAREQLRIAHEMLARFGADAFADRARRELAAAGEAVRPRALSAAAALTAQESQIARLAAAGRTNPEIGSELFISRRTVEYHLGKVFTKLGIRARGELPSALRELAQS